MTAAVWVVGGPGDREDLRHSLRSVATNAPDIAEAWVIGDVPGWFAGVKMPLEPLAEKFANQRASLTAFVNYPAAPSSAYIFNDDMFVIEPVTGLLPTCRNKNPASSWAKAEQDGGRSLNTWHRAVLATAQWTAKRTGADPFIYEAHTPLLFDTALLRDAINDYPDDQPFAVGELYPIAGLGGEGSHCGNAKVKAADSLDTKLANPMPYLSGNPDSWTGSLGEHIRSTFTTPCQWER